MAKTRSKRYQDQTEELDPHAEYSLDEAVELALEQATANFTETMECHVRLGIDPSEADQQIRGSIELPAGTGREVRVIAFAQGEKKTEAEEAGADEAGGEDLIEKIQDGWMEFDQAVATPDMMSDVSALGPVLGPRNLMPNNKAGTVTFDIGETIEKLKKGQIEVRNDSYGIVHCSFGTSEMDASDLRENLLAVLTFLLDNRPPAFAEKGQFFKSISISPTMGASVKVDPGSAWSAVL